MLQRNGGSPSTSDEIALEAVAARGWWPAETAMLGGWLLRADHGITRRANSVLPLGAPNVPLDEALATARAWYAERSLPLYIHTPVEARRLLAAELGERGWHPEGDTHVLTAALTDTPAPAGVHLAPEPPEPDDGMDPRRRALAVRHERVVFASVRREGVPVATARGTLDGDWLGITEVQVAEEHRRQGLARDLMAALQAWGRGGGAGRAYLQVMADNAPAVALYTSLGYTHHHDYRYWRDPDSTPR